MSVTQRAVAGFFVGVWALIVALRLVAEDTLRLALGIDEPVLSLFIAGITALIAVLLLGIVRRWRWIFWLLLLVFLGGVPRILASALELMGVIPTPLPAWYVTLQGAIGLVQVALAAVMFRSYRRSGVWS